MTEKTWYKFEHAETGPQLRLVVPDQEGTACHLKITFAISLADASCWKRPVTIDISPIWPYGADAEQLERAKQQSWETVVDLSREDVRFMRDYLTMLLHSPDIRQNEDGTWITGKQEPTS